LPTGALETGTVQSGADTRHDDDQMRERDMVVKILSGGVGGDLGNPLDQNGDRDDTIAVEYESTAFNYSIYTLKGDDILDLTAANPAGYHYIYTGVGNDTVFGGDAHEYVNDQAGADLYLLGGGHDLYYSGSGNDVANGGSDTDTLGFYYRTSNSGIRTDNTAAVTCDLAIRTVQDFGVFGRDRVSGFETIEGGGGNDRFFGTGGENYLLGEEGNDYLVGRGGSDGFHGGGGRDSMFGGNGADMLAGRDGRDLFVGGGGADYFALDELTAVRDVLRYQRMSDSGNGLGSANVDVVEAFDAGIGAVHDKIDLSAIDANRGMAGNQAFRFRGAAEFSSPAGEVRVATIGADCLVMVDIDGDGVSEMNIRMVGVTTLAASDFIL
jgi:serralysin